MPAFDASSMIYAWDNYPADQFPGLWEWLGEQIAQKELVMLDVAFDEVNYKTPECAAWLMRQSIKLFETDEGIVKGALAIKQLLGITDDDYHPKGVDENDLFIIAAARQHGLELVSNEARQKTPDVVRKCKIPAVCNMPEVAVRCLDFLEFLKRSKAVFR